MLFQSWESNDAHLRGPLNEGHTGQWGQGWTMGNASERKPPMCGEAVGSCDSDFLEGAKGAWKAEGTMGREAKPRKGQLLLPLPTFPFSSASPPALPPGFLLQEKAVGVSLQGPRSCFLPPHPPKMKKGRQWSLVQPNREVGDEWLFLRSRAGQKGQALEPGRLRFEGTSLDDL